MSQLEQELKQVLGPTYGGPSLSAFDGAFVLYRWFDGPVSVGELGRGDTIANCLLSHKHSQEESRNRELLAIKDKELRERLAKSAKAKLAAAGLTASEARALGLS